MTEHNEQVAKLISALGDNSAGRRAVLRAVAKRQGFDDEDEVEDMLHGAASVERSMGLDFLMSWLLSTS